MRLDVGCGGSGASEIKENVDTGYVFSPLSIRRPRDVAIDIRKPKEKRENFVLASGEALPFKDKTFSFAFSLDVLEHVNGPVYMVEEMKRVSHNLFIVTPNSLYLPCILMSMVRKDQRYRPYPDHVAIWSKAEMEGLLNRVGFKKYTVSWLEMRKHKAHWYVRLLVALCPFPALRYRALAVVAEC
jgi:hypothetical protein